VTKDIIPTEAAQDQILVLHVSFLRRSVRKLTVFRLIKGKLRCQTNDAGRLNGCGTVESIMNLRIILSLALALGGGLFGCSTSGPHSLERFQVNDVVILPGSDPANGTLRMALPVLDAAPTVFTTQQPITSIKMALKVLPEVQKSAGYPIDVVTEYKGWFWYGVGALAKEGSEFDDEPKNKITPEPKTLKEKWPVMFIWGYAIKKGNRNVVKWSNW
jgi:hypothetical protein